MQIVIPIIQLLIQAVLPERAGNTILWRIHQSAKIIEENRHRLVFKVLKGILFIVFFPIIVTFKILEIIIKLLAIWLFPLLTLRRVQTLFGDLTYCLNEYRLDKCVRGFDYQEAFERFRFRLKFYINGREKSVHFGSKNVDKTFLLIRPYYYSESVPGFVMIPHLFSQYYMVLQNLEDAKRHGWIPVVDWKNFSVAHTEKFPINGTTNAWEYFFEQPSNYSLEEVYESRHVILSYQNFMWYEGMSIPHFLNFDHAEDFVEKISEIAPEYAHHVPLNRFTLEHCEQAYAKIFPTGKKILGVACRTTPGKLLHLSKDTPDRMSPDVKLLIQLIKKRMRDWQADYVFFTNEEEENIAFVQQVFKEKVIVYPRRRYKNFHHYSNISAKPTNDDYDPLYIPGSRYQTNLDYLTEIYLLSKCDMLLCSVSGGAKTAFIWNEGKYEQTEIIDLGQYRGKYDKY